jgi:hypothetical protein
MKTEEEFTAACQALGKNDPRHAELNLAEYGALLDQERVQQVTEALEKNTFVEDVTFSTNLCVYSTLRFNHFLKTSPSLKRLQIQGKAQDPKEDEEKAIINAVIVLESISRNSVLVSLTLSDVLLGDDCHLEGFLSSTRTLLQFSFFQSYAALSYPAARAIGIGLTQNKSLEKLSWEMTQGFKFLEEVLCGLSNHIGLKTLELKVKLTGLSSLALRFLLKFNRTLEHLFLTQDGANERFETMVAVLAGLAENTGLKEFTFDSDFGETNATLATAWTKMLQRNASITMLDLRKPNRKTKNADAESELCTAVAKGLVSNSTLETLYVPDTKYSVVLHGPVWQEMLVSNHCVKKLCFSKYSISLETFQCLARGLSHNTSLESLDLRDTNMTDDCVIALVGGLRTNKTLKCLDLSNNSALSQSGRAAIERLIGHNIFFYLSLNRHGRLLLRPPEGAEAPSGLWPRVLAKITGPRDMSLLFYFLQNKPEIVNWNAPANP